MVIHNVLQKGTQHLRSQLAIGNDILQFSLLIKDCIFYQLQYVFINILKYKITKIILVSRIYGQDSHFIKIS